MVPSVEQILAEALTTLENTTDAESVRALSIRYLGRKGAVTLFLRGISQMPPAERAAMGQRANAVKKTLEEAFKDAVQRLESSRAEAAERIDVSLPGRPIPVGTLHP
ncbi:MAG: phenylalanine--tRNA ligase subunit alpha, partial [Desulfobacterales bacterium]